MPLHQHISRRTRNKIRKVRRYGYVAVSEQIAYHHYRTKKNVPEQVRAVIFGQGRTGSTLLESLIASTGVFRQHGELLSSKIKTIRRPIPYLIGLSRWHRGHFIFHTKIYHLHQKQRQVIDPVDYLGALQEEGWKIIYIRRKNIIRHVLSNLVARKRGAYHKFRDYAETIRLDIDLEDFVKKVHRRVRYVSVERDVLKHFPHVSVVYEDDLLHGEKHQETANRVFEFLGAGKGTVSTRHRKVNPYPLKELIVNYDAFMECMKENDWLAYIDE